MAQLFANNVSMVLSAALAQAASSLTVQTGQGAAAPSPTGSDYILLTIVSPDGEDIEVVKCTARSSDTFSGLTRGQEGTSDQSFAAGSKVQMRVTKGTLERFAQTGVGADFDTDGGDVTTGGGLIDSEGGEINVGGGDLNEIDEAIFTSAGAGASAAGRLRRNGTDLFWHDGTSSKKVLTAGGSVGDDLLGLDELAFTDASANATAAGRLRRNGTILTWHNGTAAQYLVQSQTAVGATLGLELIASNSVEATTTSTTDVSLVTLTPTGGVPDDAWLLVVLSVRKTDGHASDADITLRIGATDISTAIDVGNAAASNQSGGIVFLVGPRIASYGAPVFAMSHMDDNSSLTETVGFASAWAANRSTGQTTVIIRGKVDNALNTLGVDSVALYAFRY
jgi:hypothetical protein